ncbi:3'-5' exonuclease family protein [Franzmannia qiaohouensis]|uniref:Excinuclease cho n=1 Tax=Franzmannia qiaohouensis TaxID=1329370 RepID=A0ABU1HER8_9GAMM|nr:exonuclease domain-containing protein [Halomonas qiaohouensis]MDR5905962.1 exonuclease domain-containing protein [Halomonas qiaohouensis]
MNTLIFLDLETTGTRTTRDRITEVAAIKVVDGHEVDRFVSLVDPGEPIPAHISRLTGIDASLVAGAPRFEALADELFAWLQDACLVAHNARFDYGFLRNEFERAGRRFTAPTLCTLKLSRRLAPHERQHNLDALLERHALSGYSRHRAEGDARAMLALWQHWQAEHGSEHIDALCVAQRRQASLPTHLDPAALRALPARPGVYLFYGHNRLPLYVGKSVNLRARVLSHFSADRHSEREMRLVQQIQDIDWQETAGDLGAQLLEARLVKTLMPIMNRQLRRRGRLVSWQWPAQQQAPSLVSGDALDGRASCALYGLFRHPRDARLALKQIAENHALCPRRLGLEHGKGACFAHQLGRCAGACCGKESPHQHDARAREALERLRVQHWPWPGRVAFGEHHPGGMQQWHLVDHWCYLGSVSDLSAASLAALAQQTPQFDVDTYKILGRFIGGDSHRLEVQPLD